MKNHENHSFSKSGLWFGLQSNLWLLINFSGQRSEEQRKKNRNSKLLRGFGNMFKIGKDSSNSNSNNNNQANVERTKDTKVLRKSCPGKKLKIF